MAVCRVIVADDHALFRQGLKMLIAGVPDLEVIGEAASGLQLLQLLETLTPDLILLDIGMPDLGGLEVLPRIKAVHPDVKVIILTMHNDREFLYRALAAGADGYCLKKEADTQFFAAIEKVRQGQMHVSPELPAQSIRDWRQVRESAQRPLLTDREREILNLIAEGKANKQVAVLLSISVHTVERHRANIMRKLELHSMAELIHYALGKKQPS